MGWTTHTEAGGSSEDGTLGTPAFVNSLTLNKYKILGLTG